jgi:hypothetical protein
MQDSEWMTCVVPMFMYVDATVRACKCEQGKNAIAIANETHPLIRRLAHSEISKIFSANLFRLAAFCGLVNTSARLS